LLSEAGLERSRHHEGFAAANQSKAGQQRAEDFEHHHRGEHDPGHRVRKLWKLRPHVVLVPNAKLAQAIVTNYHLPDKEMAVLVNVGVDYDSDLHEFVKRLHERYRREGITIPFPIRTLVRRDEQTTA
jgi:hypothetical protein